MNKTLYICLIEEQDTKEPFFQTYYARASNIGEAIQMTVDSAKTNGLHNPVPRECDFFDINHLEAAIYPHAEADVFWLIGRCFFPPEPTFVIPIGVIASGVEGEHDVDEITRGHTMQTDENGLTTIEVNAETNQLFPLYKKLLLMHPEYKVFCYVLHGHWQEEGEEEEEEKDRFLVNKQLNSPDKILNHLRSNWVNSVQNGHVTLTSYLEEGATNLSISDHKRIVIATYSPAAAEQYAKLLDESGYPRAAELISFDRGMHHWHYRLPGSMTKAELEKMLKTTGFTDWKPK